MANEQQFGTYSNPNDPATFQIEDPPRKRSGWQTCLIGCLVVLLVVVLLAVVVGFWASQHWRGWFAGIGSQAINQAIDASDLPAQEKVEVKAQVKRVTKGFADGRISIEQSQTILKKLTESPLMPSLVVTAVDKRYFEKSQLTNEEKDEGRRVLRRFARGVFDGKIKDKGIDSVMQHIADRNGNQWQLRPNVSDDDLRAAIKDAKAQADEASIPEAPANIDPSDEVKRIIDESLQETKPEIEK